MAYWQAKILVDDIIHNTQKLNNRYFVINEHGLYFFYKSKNAIKHHKIVYQCTVSSITKQISTIQKESGCSKKEAAQQVVDILYSHMSDYDYSLRTSNLTKWLDMLSNVYKLGRKQVNNKSHWVPYEDLKDKLLNCRLSKKIITIQHEAIDIGIGVEPFSKVPIHFWDRQ